MSGADTDAKAAVLLVSDEWDERASTRRILEGAGFSVTGAAPGAEIPILQAGLTDLVVTDNADVSKRLKGDPLARHPPVLQLQRAGDSRSAPAPEADACLEAPADPAALVAVASALVRAGRAERHELDAACACQAALDGIGFGVGLLDSAGLFRQVNRAMCELLGKTGDEILGSTHREAPSGAEEPERGWPFERARRSLGRESAEIEAGGRWFEVMADPLLDASGAFAGAVSTVMDVTARKSAEREREHLLSQLDGERARLETVLQQMPAGVIMAEAPSGTLVMINGRVESIFRGPFRTGGGVKDYLQYPAFRPQGRPYRPEEHPLARTVATGEAVADEEMEFVRADGTRAAVLVSSTPIRDREGLVVAGVLTLHDVTERSQLEQQLRQAQKMEAMGRLAGGVAHDFNNLLTIIGGYGQMVRDALAAEDPLRKDLDAILESSDRASALTRQLLTFSRRQMVEPRVLDLNRQVSKVHRMLRRVIGEDIELVTILTPDATRIKADPAQIEQVLLNLAVNARDAMPKGGELTIETAVIEAAAGTAVPGALKPGPYVTLVIADTGIGMDAETQSHLFEPFFTTKRKGKGTGLGLSTVYGIVKQSAGEVVIESELGRGTSVRIFFPLAEERVKAAGAAGHRPAARPGTETILLVEDDAEVRRLTAEMLTRQGYAVLEAASGQTAIRLWQQHKASIDMLLTDVVMPLMAGPELATRLRAGRPELKVLYMSGYAGELLEQYGVASAAAAFLHKPFTSDVLAHSVRALLDGKGGA